MHCLSEVDSFSWCSHGFFVLLLKPILQYAIFPAQFAFLYSYYPSGRMDDVAQRLTEEWKSRHYESSEEAFTRADKGFIADSGPSFFQKADQPETVLAARK